MSRYSRRIFIYGGLCLFLFICFSFSYISLLLIASTIIFYEKIYLNFIKHRISQIGLINAIKCNKHGVTCPTKTVHNRVNQPQTSKLINSNNHKSVIPLVSLERDHASRNGLLSDDFQGPVKNSKLEARKILVTPGFSSLLVKTYDLAQEKKLGNFHRINSTNMLYPTHQSKSPSIGLLPVVKWNKFETSSYNMTHRPTQVLMNMTSPKVLKSSNVNGNLICSSTENKPSDPCDSKSVIAALKAKRKRNFLKDQEEYLDDDQILKRQRNDSDSSSGSAFTPTNSSLPNSLSRVGSSLNLSDSLMLEDKQKSSLESSTCFPNSIRKGFKNNEILSSYSSTRRLSEIMRRSSLPGKRKAVENIVSHNKSKLPRKGITGTTVKDMEISCNSSQERPTIDDAESLNMDDRTSEDKKSCEENSKVESSVSPVNITVSTFHNDSQSKSRYKYEKFHIPAHLATLEEHEEDKRRDLKRLHGLLEAFEEALGGGRKSVLEKVTESDLKKSSTNISNSTSSVSGSMAATLNCNFLSAPSSPATFISSSSLSPTTAFTSTSSLTPVTAVSSISTLTPTAVFSSNSNSTESALFNPITSVSTLSSNPSINVSTAAFSSNFNFNPTTAPSSDALMSSGIATSCAFTSPSLFSGNIVKTDVTTFSAPTITSNLLPTLSSSSEQPVLNAANSFSNPLPLITEKDEVKEDKLPSFSLSKTASIFPLPQESNALYEKKESSTFTPIFGTCAENKSVTESVAQTGNVLTLCKESAVISSSADVLNKNSVTVTPTQTIINPFLSDKQLPSTAQVQSGGFFYQQQPFVATPASTFGSATNSLFSVGTANRPEKRSAVRKRITSLRR